MLLIYRLDEFQDKFRSWVFTEKWKFK